ncbi:MAG: T9SS type A sorting domain-containing protein [Candidatus Cloacimonetes bacterium]|nr:T9SS type A sorting domain-containing protein [Candidatus Cloacimonadota bacterium]
MRKIIIIVILIISINLNAEIIEKTFFFDKYEISEINEYQIINFNNTLPTGKIGEPVLPYHSVSLMLPPGEIAESIEIIGENEKQIPGNFQLYPQQHSRPISKGNSGEFQKNEKIYASEEQYPARLSGELTTQYSNGYAFGLSTFTPLMYIPSRGRVSYFQKVTVKITTNPDSRSSKAMENLRSSNEVLNRVSNFAQNPEMISRYPFPTNRDDEYQLLIITPSQFENDFQDLIELYLIRGILTEITTTEFINSSMPGQDLQEKIRNYIIQEYQDNGIEQVLLAGDVEHVPYRGFYCYVDSGGGYEDDDIPADLYYSALDGTWNDDGDNLWGEIDEDDLLPEISVGRMSFSNLSELNIMFNKTISYQNTPVLGELQKLLLAGEHMYSNPLTWGGDFLDLLIGFHDDNGYTTNGIPVDHDYETMYDRDLGSWSATQLINKINEGKAFIHHAGHASTNYCMRMNTSDITNTNFSLVNGVDHNFTHVYTHGCLSGAFDSDDCIAEYMVKIDNFAAAFVGNSRYGWFNEGQTEGPSLHLHREFVDALYSDKTCWIGSAHLESKIDTSPWVTAPGQWEEGALRWCFYGCNVLGDPALSIWTDEPIEIDVTHNSVIFLGTSTYSVHVESGGIPVEDMQCTLMQDGELIGTETTNTSGNAEIMFDAVSVVPGEANLIISGYNRPPIIYPVQVIPPGYCVIVESYSIFSGNDDVLEFGENALLSMNLEVFGIGGVHNVIVNISTEDNYITINDSTEYVDFIALGSIVEINDAFDFDVSNNVPDEHSIDFLVLITCDEGGWQSGLSFTAYAPVISLGNVVVQDGENGVLDPGEEAELVIELNNAGGADAYNLIPSVLSTDPYISITIIPLVIDSLNANSSGSYAICSVVVSEEAPLGHVIDFDFELSADNDYFVTDSFSLVVGLCIEDFETGDFSSYNWEFTGNADWIIDINSYEGAYCAKSGSITHNQETWLILEADILCDDEISFWRKVSCEDVGSVTGNYYDYLSFYIDDIEMDKWAGEKPWEQVSFPVTAGNHSFKWRYIKDQALTSGSDCAWIDYIIFPPLNLEVSSENELVAPSVAKLYGNYPNPFNPSTTISFSVSQTSSFVTLDIFNIKGQKVKTLINEALSAGQHSVVWNGKDEKGKNVSSGVYFYKLNTGNYEKTKKMILLK